MEKNSDISLKIDKLKREISILNQKQHAFKILLNAGYGALGSVYFSHFDIRLAEAVTYTSQLVIRYMIQYLEKNLGIEIIYSDTDSLYLSVEPQVRKYCKKTGKNYEDLTYEQKREIYDLLDKKISKVIKRGYELLSKRLNVRENDFKMVREIYGNKAIWLGKKNYLIKMIDKDGNLKSPETPPYVKGFDIVKSGATTKWIIEALKEYAELIFTEDKEGVVKFEKEKFQEYKKQNPFSLFKPKSLSSMNKYTFNSKGCPIHIKAALVYNMVVKEHNLQADFPEVSEGNKILFAYIQKPNRFNSHVIGYSDQINEEKFWEFVIKHYTIKLDYQKMWDTDFISPARRLTDALKWDISNFNKSNFANLLKEKK